MTTIGNPYQPAAQEALQAGLIGYDRRYGYRDRRRTMIYRRRQGAGLVTDPGRLRILADYPTIGALRPALVVRIRDRSVMAFNTESGLFALRAIRNIGTLRLGLDQGPRTCTSRYRSTGRRSRMSRIPISG